MTAAPRKMATRRAAVALLAALCPVAASAAPAVFDGRYLLQVAGSLLLVLGALLGVLYLLKRMNGLPVAERKGVRVLASLKVGTREKVLLLEAGSRQLLVGVAAGSVRTLYVFDEAADEPDDHARLNRTAQEPRFPDVLHQAAPEQSS